MYAMLSCLLFHFLKNIYFWGQTHTQYSKRKKIHGGLIHYTGLTIRGYPPCNYSSTVSDLPLPTTIDPTIIKC